MLIKFHDGSDVANALGLVWDPSSDQLLLNFSQLPTNQRPTKRVALSTIAKLYDPLGLITQILTIIWAMPEPILPSWGELTSQ